MDKQTVEQRAAALLAPIPGPSPAGDFGPVMRMDEPDPSILDGAYRFLPITRTD